MKRINRLHDGTARQIREALALSTVPLSVWGIHLATGIPVEKVRASLSTSLQTAGKIVSTRGDHGIVYSLYRPPARPKTQSGSGRIAAKIEIGRGMRWFPWRI